MKRIFVMAIVVFLSLSSLAEENNFEVEGSMKPQPLPSKPKSVQSPIKDGPGELSQKSQKSCPDGFERIVGNLPDFCISKSNFDQLAKEIAIRTCNSHAIKIGDVSLRGTLCGKEQYESACEKVYFPSNLQMWALGSGEYNVKVKKDNKTCKAEESYLGTGATAFNTVEGYHFRCCIQL